MSSWKRTGTQYREALIDELERMKSPSSVISCNVPLTLRGAMTPGVEPRDVGVAVYFSRRTKEDFSWQEMLSIRDPIALDVGVIDVGFGGDAEIETLREENRRLQRAVDDAERDARRAREDAQRALSALRSNLGPLYRALQMVFGELDAAGVTESPQAPYAGSEPASVDNAARAKWEKWIQSVGAGSPAARFIETLLVHGELSAKQMKTAAKMGEATVYQAASKLGKLGLVTKSGTGKYILSQI